MQKDSAPLQGLVVLDLTRVLAGPYCTRLLSDLGARVIKIERPGTGDEMRRAMLQLEPGREDQSTYYVRCNAGRRASPSSWATPPRVPSSWTWRAWPMWQSRTSSPE